jgi:hypothetical protein
VDVAEVLEVGVVESEKVCQLSSTVHSELPNGKEIIGKAFQIRRPARPATTTTSRTRDEGALYAEAVAAEEVVAATQPAIVLAV